MLEVSHITKDFAPPLSLGRIARLDFGRGHVVRALDDVSFSLPKGAILGVLGPNGAGKTTLLKILSTLILPDAGTAAVNGFRLGADDDRIKASVGLVASAERSLYWRLTGRQNLDFFAAMYGLSRRQAQSRIDGLFEIFGVTYQDKRFDSYSTGMQQNFGLMRALLHDPPLLLLDEPTKSLDYATALKFRDFIKEGLVKGQGKTVVFTTHHMEEAAEFADIFMILHKAKVFGFGTLEDLREKVKNKSATLGEIFLKITGAAGYV